MLKVDVNEFNAIKQENLRISQLEREASRKVKEYVKQFALWQNQVRVLIVEYENALKNLRAQEALARGTNRQNESALLLAKAEQLNEDIKLSKQILGHILLGRMQ